MAVLVLHHQQRGSPCPPQRSSVSSSFVFGVLGIGTILLFGIHLIAFAVWFPSLGTITTLLANDPPAVVLLPQHYVPPPQNGIINGTATMEEKEKKTRNDKVNNVSNNNDDDVNQKFAEKSMALRSLLAAGIAEETILQHYGELPTNTAIIDLYGPRPIVIGLEWCETYRQSVPALQRTLGAAGMFSTGTNLVTQLLKRNCVIPERAAFYGETTATKEELGVRWQVPWGKHTPAVFRERHAATERAAAINIADVLPVVTIRHPWRWMQSMCRNPYAAHWPHYHQCPNLMIKDNKDHDNNNNNWNNVTVQYGAAAVTYQSLAHLWNDWYRSYLNTSLTLQQQQPQPQPQQHDGSNDHPNQSTPHHYYYPWLMIRMEDLTFYTEETTKLICDCAGGRLLPNQKFIYVADSAKADAPAGHDTTTNLLQAYVKYSRPLAKAAGFSDTDYHAARTALDDKLMDLFSYQSPPAP